MRIFLLDFTRGICVLAMIVYHFFWDLGYFGVVDHGLITQGLGLLVAQLIGLSFITIAGISSRLLSLSNNFKTKFLKRFLKLLFISVSISFVTFMLDSKSFIFFGILHFLLVCSLISLIMFRIRNLLALFIIFFGAAVISMCGITFDLPVYLSWIGFNKALPITNDFYPLFPWMTFYFFGFFLGEMIFRKLKTKFKKSSITYPEIGIIFKLCVYVGQKSLIVYLVHQPVLFSLFFIFIQLSS